MNGLAFGLGIIVLCSVRMTLAQAPPPTNSSSPVTWKCNSPDQLGGWTEAAPGGSPDKVWVDSTTLIFYRPNSRRYGKTSCGRYMSEADARGSGARPDPWYVAYVQSEVAKHWVKTDIDPRVPEGATVFLHFTISRAGLISDLGVSQSSGSPSLDDSCIKAVQAVHFFDPLPAEYKDPTLRVSYYCSFKH
jgi:TonB family protein